MAGRGQFDLVFSPSVFTLLLVMVSACWFSMLPILGEQCRSCRHQGPREVILVPTMTLVRKDRFRC